MCVGRMAVEGPIIIHNQLLPLSRSLLSLMSLLLEEENDKKRDVPSPESLIP